MSDHHVDIAEYARELAQTVDDLIQLTSYMDLEDLNSHDSDAARRLADQFGYKVSDEVEMPELTEGWVLEVEHFRSTQSARDIDGGAIQSGRYITHVLLTYGGPTVRVTIRPDDSAELFHSWGERSEFGTGESPWVECPTWEMPDGFGKQLRSLVRPWE